MYKARDSSKHPVGITIYTKKKYYYQLLYIPHIYVNSKRSTYVLRESSPNEYMLNGLFMQMQIYLKFLESLWTMNPSSSKMMHYFDNKYTNPKCISNIPILYMGHLTSCQVGCGGMMGMKLVNEQVYLHAHNTSMHCTSHSVHICFVWV